MTSVLGRSYSPSKSWEKRYQRYVEHQKECRFELFNQRRIRCSKDYNDWNPLTESLTQEVNNNVPLITEVNPTIASNLMDTEVLKKTIDSCITGDNELLAKSLEMFDHFIDTIRDNEEMSSVDANVVNSYISAVVKALSERVEHLKWRTSRVSSQELKTNCHTLFSKEMSEGVRHLCQTISFFASQLVNKVCDHLNDSHRLFLDMKPLMSKLLTCGDSQTTIHVIQTLNVMVSLGDNNLLFKITESFGQILIELLKNSDQQIVLTTLQLLNQLFSALDYNGKSYLLFYGEFGRHLMDVLRQRLPASDENVIKDVLYLITIVSQTIVWVDENTANDGSSGHYCDHLISGLLCLCIYLSDNPLMVMSSVEEVLNSSSRYQLKNLLNRIVVFSQFQTNAQVFTALHYLSQIVNQYLNEYILKLATVPQSVICF